MSGRIQLLDCTLRDGGFGLEDAEKNELSSKRFQAEDIDHIIDHLTCSRIDIIELGTVEITRDDRRGFAIYPDMESISEKIPEDRREGQIYTAFFRGPDIPLADIPDWNPSLCDAIRVIIRYSEQQKSLDFCKALAEKGYKVFVQPMLTMRYTREEIGHLIAAANEMKAFALYFVDSYGYMMQENIAELFKRYDNELDPGVKIGFHAHNNMNLAFANVLAFLEQSTERNIIIDSCILGMGQGAGNLQTELIVDYLNKRYSFRYDYDEILEICEIIEKYNADNIWGYSVTRLLPALNKAAYKYAIVLRSRYHLSYSEINAILRNIPEDLRHRFTTQNTIELLRRNGYDPDITDGGERLS